MQNKEVALNITRYNTRKKGTRKRKRKKRRRNRRRRSGRGEGRGREGGGGRRKEEKGEGEEVVVGGGVHQVGCDSCLMRLGACEHPYGGFDSRIYKS